MERVRESNVSEIRNVLFRKKPRGKQRNYIEIRSGQAVPDSDLGTSRMHDIKLQKMFFSLTVSMM